MRTVLTIFIIIAIQTVMRSQNATATLGTYTTCPPDTVLVPLDVTNYEDVAAMTYEIAYDTNKMVFLGLQNINPAVPGSILFNATDGEVLVSWSSLTGFYLSADKLFDLRFSFLSDSSELHWNFIEIANSNLVVLPVDSIPGGVFNQISISHHPDSTQAYPGSNVSFLVTSSGNTGYQWQENTGAGWTDLNNTYPYSGTNTHLLSISFVQLTFDGNLYRCHLYSDECQLDSEQALLEVATAFPEATIGDQETCPATSVLVPLDVFDFNDITEFTFNIAFSNEVLTFVSLQNNHQFLSGGLISTEPLSGSAGISIHWISSGGPVNFGEIKLFDMKFNFSQSSSDIVFVDGTLVLNSFSNPVNIDLFNGSVSQDVTAVITSQPEDLTVQQGDEAEFSVTASGAEEYQWQVSQDNGNQWIELSNTPPYSNVTTDDLTISNTPLSLNGNLYRCIIDNYICQVISESAQLTVDSLNNVQEMASHEIIVNVSPNPSSGVFRISLDEFNYEKSALRIFDLAGRELLNLKSETNNTYIIEDTDITSGLFMGIVEIVIEGKTYRKNFKLIKTIN